MQESKNKLPKKQAVSLYQFRPMSVFPQPTGDPTTPTVGTIITTTHIFKG